MYIGVSSRCGRQTCPISKEGSQRGVAQEAHGDQYGNDDWRNEPALHSARPPARIFDDPRSAACVERLGAQSRAKRFALAICAAFKREAMRSYPDRAR